jgi:hypothetical protein
MSLPVSELGVVNYALSELGIPPVVSIMDNQKAQIIDNKINTLFSIFLKSTTWNFAIKYISDNTPLTQNFSPDYPFTYQLPSDYGRFFKFSTNTFPLSYQFTDDLLLIDVRPAAYWYVVNTVPYDVITDLFYRALAIFAASDCAYVLTNNEKLASYLLQKYKDCKDEAILLNDMERQVQTMPHNDFDRQVFI